ncbi:MAG: metallophosphoesterase [Lachnospiraceae bacterium]|nr:metallophosphoesterase [Candidatus Minthocola equi]
MNFKKRISCLILSIVMVLSLLPSVTLGAESQSLILIANNGKTYALSSATSDTYNTTGGSGGTYSGFKGVAYTEGTTTVTADMLWNVTNTGTTYTIKQGEKYLTGTYSSGQGNLTLGTSATTWTYNTTNKTLGISGGGYIRHSDGSSGLPTGSAPNIISGNTVTFVEYKDSPSQDAPVRIAVISDVHNSTDNVTANRVTTWLNGISTKIGADFDLLVAGGDYARGDNSLSGTSYWNATQAVLDAINNNTHIKGSKTFLAGNHEWTVFNGGDMANYRATNTTAQKIKIDTGEIAKTDKYIVYAFGATQGEQSFNTTDITNLGTYLSKAPTDVPIFIISHYPLHSFGTRATTNAASLISVLNTYGATRNIYFFWGHNHSSGDTNYGQIMTEKIGSTDINFTYCPMGAMTDTSDSFSGGTVQEKGVIITIDNGTVTLDFYDVNLNRIGGTSDPISGGDKYLILQNGYALSSAATGSYTTSGGDYSGLKGVKYTAGTTTVTADMLWDITSQEENKYVIMQNGKYLKGTYTSGSPSTATLELTDTPTTWTLTSDNKLCIGSGYLLHSDGSSGVTGNPNVFSMRSSGNAKAVTFTKYTTTPTDPEQPTSAGKHLITITVNGTVYALSSKATGYYECGGGNYSGFEGVVYTAGTTPVTNDMLWDVSISGTTYTIMQGGKYLKGTYDKPADKATGTLTMSTDPFTWTMTGGKLQMQGSTYYLAHSKGTSGLSTGYENANVFSIRSSSNAQNVSVTEYKGTISGVKIGDVNNDGYADSEDAMYVLMYDVGTLTSIDLAAGDVNGDGYVDSEDAMYILMYDVGTIQKFPAE